MRQPPKAKNKKHGSAGGYGSSVNVVQTLQETVLLLQTGTQVRVVKRVPFPLGVRIECLMMTIGGETDEDGKQERDSDSDRRNLK